MTDDTTKLAFAVTDAIREHLGERHDFVLLALSQDGGLKIAHNLKGAGRQGIKDVLAQVLKHLDSATIPINESYGNKRPMNS